MHKDTTKNLCESILLFVLHQKINSQTYHDFTARNSRNTLQLKILPEKITKETFMGKHVKGIMYFSFFSLKIYCRTVQRQNARLSQLHSSLKDCIFSELRRENYPLPQYSRRKGTENNIPHALNVFFSN